MKIISRFIMCNKFEGKSCHASVTASLPDFRVSEAAPFSKCGLDSAGPLYYKDKQGNMSKVSNQIKSNPFNSTTIVHVIVLSIH